MKYQQIKSIKGEVLFEGIAPNFKSLVEQAASEQANLQNANFRKMDLSAATLDGGFFIGADFHGTNLKGANLSECALDTCDFRLADLSDACLAESQMSMCKFHGTTFTSGTIITDTDMRLSEFSCPSFFSMKLIEAATTDGSTFTHLGEIDCPVSKTPIVISGLPFQVVFMDKHLKVGPEVKTYEAWSELSEEKIRLTHGAVAAQFFKDFYFAGLFSAAALDRYRPAEHAVAKRKQAA